MKLVSATVRNYRLHREVMVEFDPFRTLIGGPNEVGKSTLIEAIHRALFLKSTVTGEAHKSMVSSISSGHPEVEVCFSTNGNEYKLTKRFGGLSGTTQLLRIGAATLSGGEAETRLAKVLGVKAAGGGRGVLDRVSQQWAHLWVWQGMSGDDPAHHAAAQQSELLQQLQQTGGTVAMQSELDGKVATRFTRARDEIFKSGENARAGTDLDSAQREVAAAQTAHSDAVIRLEKLQQAINSFETAEATVQRTATDLEELGKQRQSLNEKLARADNLQQSAREQKGAVVSAKDSLDSLEKAEQSIGDLRRNIAEVRGALEPKQVELRQAESRVADLRKCAEEAEREHLDDQDFTRNARLRRDLAAAHVSVLEKRTRMAELQKHLDRVRTLQDDIRSYRHQLSEFPKVDRDALKELQSIEGELGQAKAALNAMAAEIEVISADLVIRVGDQPIEQGGSRTIAETTDVMVGDSVCLRIHPGGGDSLGEARKNVRALNERLQSALDQCGGPRSLDSRSPSLGLDLCLRLSA